MEQGIYTGVSGAALKESNVADLEYRINQIIGKRDLLEKQIAEEQSKIEVLSHEIDITKQTVDLLTALADQRREFLKTKVEDLVTYGISAVFGVPYTFFFDVDEHKGLRSMTPKVSLNGEVMDIVNAHGGGLVVVIGFLLRVVTLALIGSKYKILLLDETFSHVSESYLEPLSVLIKTVTSRLGIQIILVSHQEVLTAAADKVYEVRLVDGSVQVQDRTS